MPAGVVTVAVTWPVAGLLPAVAAVGPDEGVRVPSVAGVNAQTAEVGTSLPNWSMPTAVNVDVAPGRSVDAAGSTRSDTERRR